MFKKIVVISSLALLLAACDSESNQADKFTRDLQKQVEKEQKATDKARESRPKKMSGKYAGMWLDKNGESKTIIVNQGDHYDVTYFSSVGKKTVKLYEDKDRNLLEDDNDLLYHDRIYFSYQDQNTLYRRGDPDRPWHRVEDNRPAKMSDKYSGVWVPVNPLSHNRAVIVNKGDHYEMKLMNSYYKPQISQLQEDKDGNLLYDDEDKDYRDKILFSWQDKDTLYYEGDKKTPYRRVDVASRPKQMSGKYTGVWQEMVHVEVDISNKGDHYEMIESNKPDKIQILHEDKEGNLLYDDDDFSSHDEILFVYADKDTLYRGGNKNRPYHRVK